MAIKRKYPGFVFFLVIILLVFSCKKEVPKGDLYAYIKNPENGLILIEEQNGCSMQLSYKPSELFVLQEIEAIKTANDSIIEVFEKQYNGQLYFILSLSCNDKGLLEDSFRKNNQVDIINQLSFELSKYVYMSSGPDTVPLLSGVLSRTYDITKSTDVLLVFSNILEDKTINQLKININGLALGMFNHCFEFEVSNLKRLPKLNYRNSH